MIENKWIEEKLKESRRPIDELLNAMYREGIPIPGLYRDLERILGQSSFWIDELKK